MNRKLLFTENNVGYLEVAAMTIEVTDEFVETIYEAKDFNSASDLKKVLTVIIMFSAMWLSGVILTWYHAFKTIPNRKLLINSELQMQRDRAKAEQDTSIESIKKYLNMYIDEVFPMVFRIQPWYERLLNEIKRHHR